MNGRKHKGAAFNLREHERDFQEFVRLYRQGMKLSKEMQTVIGRLYPTLEVQAATWLRSWGVPSRCCDAPDVVQDWFQRMDPKGLSIYDDGKLFWPLAKRVLLHGCATMARKNKFVEAVELDREVGRNERQLDAALRRERAGWVVEDLAKLSPIEQDVLVYRHVDELSPKEVGKLVGRSPNGVCGIDHRARLRMQKHLRGRDVNRHDF